MSKFAQSRKQTKTTDMKRIFISAAFLIASGSLCVAAEFPQWLRNTAISPDGKEIAFTSGGDIFVVSSQGGKARQLTTNPGYDSDPVWSPDGKKIAFSSTRAGSKDIYIVNAEGGVPRRLTTHSGNEMPLAFRDAAHILFRGSMTPSAEDISGTFNNQVYEVDTIGSRPRLFASLSVEKLSAAPDGRILYQDKKGYEDPLRKHERSAGTGDIWLMTGGPEFKFRKLTGFNGHDINPAWGDGDTFYYVSEEDGTLNVYSSSVANPSQKKQLTKFTKHPVRSLSASSSGLLAFSQDGSIYTLRPGSEPVKLDVEILADGTDAALSETVRKAESLPITSTSLSPDGKEIAFAAGGDVFVTSVKYKTTKQITSTPGQERIVSFSPDGKFIVYDSERDGKWQLYKAEAVSPEKKGFAYAYEIKETPLTANQETSFQPMISPDGKKVAYLVNRCGISVLDLATGKSVAALPEKYNYSYTDGDIEFEWSPDSKWLLATYMGEGGWNNKDIALVKADGSETVDLTESGYSDSNMKFAFGGKAVTWQSDKAGYRSHGSWGSQDDIYIMFLDPEAYTEFKMTEEELALKNESEKEKEDAKNDGNDKKGKSGKKKDAKEAKDAKEDLKFDFDSRRHRMRRLTDFSGNIIDYWLSKDGDKLYYLGYNEGEGNLWLVDLKEGDMTKVAKNVGLGSLEADAEGKKLFISSPAGIKSFDTSTKEIENVEYTAPQKYNPYKEREYIFDHMRTLVADKFYDKNLHGVDWDGYTSHYRKFLPAINNSFDFAELLSETLGELNASHTGGRYKPGMPASKTTASLGAFYDEEYTGDGLRIKEIMKGGPLAESGLKPGDIIRSIDGEKILAGKDYFPLLAGKASKDVRLDVLASGKEKTVRTKPVDSESELLYARWVERNEAMVDSISGGKIAYVHVEDMDSPSFRRVYDRLLGKYRNHDAAVVDTRHNGGGWLHNDLCVLLSGKEYVTFDPQGRRIGHEPFSRWTKPSVMLVNESNYSDAYGTPYSYKTLEIGKIVGAPVPGTMTAVWWEYQVDPSIVFGVPQVTNSDLQGRPLENHQLEPDIVVYNDPADVMKGRDAQIEASVKELMRGK